MAQLVIGKPLVPSFSKIQNDSERQHYWTCLLRDWNLPQNRNFPGCNPLSVSRQTLQLLKKHKYMVTLKSDGVRYILYCTLRPGSTPSNPLPVALMIDRSQNMYEVDIIGQEDFFVKRTILEGELVWKQPKEQILLFLVFDCVRSRGESLLDRPFTVRLAEAERCVRFSDELSRMSEVEQRALETNNLVMMHFQPSIMMRAKNFVDLENAQRLWSERSDVEHRVDGLIMQRSDIAYTVGTAKNGESLKWKQYSTIDLAGPELNAADGRIRTSYFDRKVVLMSSKIVAADADDVIEYMIRFTEKTIELFALRRRVDKKTPNGLRVVEATISDVMENIEPKEISLAQ